MKVGTGGIPPQISEVRIARKRGGQPGNSNRRKHGAFSRGAADERRRIVILVKAAENLIVRVHMVARARAALRRKLARKSSPVAARNNASGGLFALLPPEMLRWRFAFRPPREGEVIGRSHDPPERRA
jgi:hypothetical protein